MISHRKWVLASILEEKLDKLAEALKMDLGFTLNRLLQSEYLRTQEQVQDVLRGHHPATM